MEVRVMPGAEKRAALSHEPFHVLNQLRSQIQALGVFAGQIDLMRHRLTGQWNGAKMLTGNHRAIDQAGQGDRLKLNRAARLTNLIEPGAELPVSRETELGGINQVV